MHELLLEYGVDALAETIVEGFSRVRRCNNEGRALMSLDLQVCRIESLFFLLFFFLLFWMLMKCFTKQKSTPVPSRLKRVV